MDASVAKALGAIETIAADPKAILGSRPRGAHLLSKRLPKSPRKRDDPHDPGDGDRAIGPRRCKRLRTDSNSSDLCGPAVLPPEVVALVLDVLPDADDVAACITSGVFRAADDEALRQRCRRTKKRDLVRVGDTGALAYTCARRGVRFEWSDAVVAASSGHVETLNWLWTRASKGHPCDILSRAASHGHVEVVRWLLRQEGNGNRWTDAQINRAIVAALSEGHDAVVDYLCETNGAACTPAALATAVVHGRLSMAKMLHGLNPRHARAIDAGTADLYDMITPRHNPALHGIGWRGRGLFDLACVSGHLGTVEFVWQSGHNGCTSRVLMCAAGGRNPDVVRFVALNRDAIEARVADWEGVRRPIDGDPVRVLMIAIPSGHVPTLAALRQLFPAVRSAYMGGLIYLTDNRDMVSFVLARTGHPKCHAGDIDLAAALGVMPHHPLPQHKSIGRLGLQTVRYACEVRGCRPGAASLLDSVSSGNIDVADYLCDRHGLRSASIDYALAGGADRHTIAAALADDLIARVVDTGSIETIERALDAWIADRQHEIYHIDAGFSRAIARHRGGDRDRIVECLLQRRRRLPTSERTKPMVLAGNGVLGAPVALLDKLHREWDMDIYALVAYDDCLGSASVSGLEWARQHGHDIIEIRHAHTVSMLVSAAATRGERRLVEWFASRGWRPCPIGVPTPCTKGGHAHYDSAAEEILAALANNNAKGD